MSGPDVFAGIGEGMTDLLTDEATVYVRQAVAPRAFVVLHRANLPCRLSTVMRQNAQSGGGRVDLASRRQLFWGAGYALPTNAQGAVDVRIQVNSRPERWGVEGPPTPVPAGSPDPELWIAELVLQPN